MSDAIKGKSAIYIARFFLGKARNYTGQSFWARGFFVSTAGIDDAVIRAYIEQQEKEDQLGKMAEEGADAPPEHNPLQGVPIITRLGRFTVSSHRFYRWYLTFCLIDHSQFTITKLAGFALSSQLLFNGSFNSQVQLFLVIPKA